jgi:hypothetical protein
MYGDTPTPFFHPSGWNESHLLELSKESKKHFLGIDPFKESKTPSLGGIRHDVVTEIKDRLSERP